MLDPSMQYRFESVLRCGGNDRRVFVLASWQATKGLQARLPKLRLAGKSVISHRVLDAPAGEQGFNGTSLTRQFGIVVIILRGPHELSIHMTERLSTGTLSAAAMWAFTNHQTLRQDAAAHPAQSFPRLSSSPRPWFVVWLRLLPRLFVFDQG